MRKPIVGERLLAVTRDHRSGPILHWIIVQKTGRLWANYILEGHEKYAHMGGRFSLETWMIEGWNHSIGQVYETEEQYREQATAKSLLTQLRQSMPYEPTADLKPDDIRQFAAKLGIALKEPFDEQG